MRFHVALNILNILRWVCAHVISEDKKQSVRLNVTVIWKISDLLVEKVWQLANWFFKRSRGSILASGTHSENSLIAWNKILVNESLLLYIEGELAVECVFIDTSNSLYLAFVPVFDILVAFCGGLACCNNSLLENFTERKINFVNQSVSVLDQSQSNQTGKVSTEKEKD